MITGETLPAVTCKCGKKLDAATTAARRDRKVKPGDLSVCVYCGNVSIFTDDMRLRDITTEEFQALDVPTALQILQIQGCIETRKKLKALSRN